MKRALLAYSRCHDCHSTVLETFTSLAGLPIRPRPRYVLPRLTRDFSDTWPRRSDAIRNESKPQQPDLEPSQTVTTNTATDTPWYLRVPPPSLPSTSTPTTPIDTEIPPLPPNAPPLLSPLLNHVYQDLGLDDLTLLDLRHLTSPPPALGPNLIMLLATARSVRHLNVSADRLCRWCRSNHKLRPFADGLLGRNELKLKLRRKARRQRLQASVGATDVGSRSLGADDGITTGWICVNVGPVEAGTVAGDTVAVSSKAEHMEESTGVETEGEQLMDEENEEEEEEYQNPISGQPQNYIGFGSASTAPRIVVQMFTEEKRVEMDLEGLWDVRRSRRAKKQEKVLNEEDTYLRDNSEQDDAQDVSLADWRQGLVDLHSESTDSRSTTSSSGSAI